MKPVIRTGAIVLLLVGTTPAADAEPASTLAGLWSLLDRCTRVVAVPSEAEGSAITVLFSVRRDGSLQGEPRITHARLHGDAEARQVFMRSAFATVARCFPLPITDELGGAVAGRPLRLRISG